MTRREWIMSGTAFSATLGLVLVLMGILASGDVMSAELTDGRTLRGGAVESQEGGYGTRKRV